MKYFFAALVLAVITIGGGLYFYSPNNTGSVTDQTNRTEDWLTYNGLGTALVFKYPRDWKLKEDRRGNNAESMVTVSVLIAPPDEVNVDGADAALFSSGIVEDSIVVVGGGQHSSCAGIRARYPNTKCEAVGTYNMDYVNAHPGVIGNNFLFTRSSRPDVLQVYERVVASLTEPHFSF